MSFPNAELRVDSVLDAKLDEGSVLLISWLLAACWTSTLSAEMMSCGPYEAAAENPAALEVPAVEAVESVVDVTGAADDAGAAAAVDALVDAAGAGVAGAAVYEAAVAEDSPDSRAPAPP
jgi:hypothetical protein